jgi:hypothetical protein
VLVGTTDSMQVRAELASPISSPGISKTSFLWVPTLL